MNKKNLKTKKYTSHILPHTSKRGITLMALIITIIVMLILSTVTITMVVNGGLFDYSRKAKEIAEITAIREEIEALSIYSKDFETLKNKLNIDGASYDIKSMYMEITTKEGYIFTILKDKTIIEGKFAYLDINDGSIEISDTGYKIISTDSETGEKTITTTEYQGQYKITGNTKENYVRIMTTGTFDITIKDLNIDLSLINGYCPFIANYNNHAKRNKCYN